jgi:hypothetical protein
MVVKAKKEKPEKKRDKATDLARKPALEASLKPSTAPATLPSTDQTDFAQPAPNPAATAGPTPGTAPAAASAGNAGTSAPQPGSAPEEEEKGPAEQLQASIAAAPEAERPADQKSVTTTTSAAHATRVLKEALARVFAPGLDKDMMAAMPDFWQLYWQSVAAKTDYRPSDPSIYRQNTVDKKAHLLGQFEPDSNEFAQAAGVAGMALYHTVVQPDGHAGEIVVGRPIGFGLDENAVQSIRKAQFEPAIKDGKPVPVLLDLVVQFRIFSGRTAVHNAPEQAAKPEEKQLPGPYTLQNMPAPAAIPATQSQTQPQSQSQPQAQPQP